MTNIDPLFQIDWVDLKNFPNSDAPKLKKKKIIKKVKKKNG